MAANQENQWHDFTLESLENVLFSLPEPDVPKSLEAKLLASVPISAGRKKIRIWTKVLGGFSAAAAVVIFASIFSQALGPASPSRNRISDLNDKPAAYVMADQNKGNIRDTNYTAYESNR